MASTETKQENNADRKYLKLSVCERECVCHFPFPQFNINWPFLHCSNKDHSKKMTKCFDR